MDAILNKALKELRRSVCEGVVRVRAERIVKAKQRKI
jgi:hypothetical protein